MIIIALLVISALLAAPLFAFNRSHGV